MSRIPKPYPHFITNLLSKTMSVDALAI